MEKLISYCVPVMNRLDDLKATLKQNIAEIGRFKGEVDLHIACFDESDECEHWVKKNFSRALEEKLVVFHRLTPLRHWHFCWAKNAFKGLIHGKYYSSLDGDNFLTEGEIAQTLEIVRDSTRPVMIHHFSGNWGDGTSGRVTLHAELYNKFGYIDTLYPRQFDEISLMLRMLVECPELRFISQHGVNIFDKSVACRDFVKLNNLRINHQHVEFSRPQAPLLPRGDGYVEKDLKLHAFQNININYSLHMLSRTEAAQKKFLGDLVQIQRKTTRTDVCDKIVKVMFQGPGLERLAHSGDVTVYAVIKDDLEFLRKWYEHYRKLGAKRFIIVDDGSGVPLETVLPGKDVFVVRPLVGSFKTFKIFWVKMLMKVYQAPGSWVLTIDADEFLDLPKVAGATATPSLSSYLGQAESHGANYVLGMLVDMMPSDDTAAINADNFIERMDHFYYRPRNQSYGYQTIPSVKWAFGENWPISFAIDLRYRLYGTVDCLRKFIAFRFYDSVDLNQGFHALYYDGTEVSSPEAFASVDRILPIRHYKMFKVLSESYDVARYAKRLDGYFERTKENLMRILTKDTQSVRTAWNLTPFKRRYVGVESVPFTNLLTGKISGKYGTESTPLLGSTDAFRNLTRHDSSSLA